jgi:hypothetical protein
VKGGLPNHAPLLEIKGSPFMVGGKQREWLRQDRAKGS